MTKKKTKKKAVIKLGYDRKSKNLVRVTRAVEVIGEAEAIFSLIVNIEKNILGEGWEAKLLNVEVLPWKAT